MCMSDAASAMDLTKSQVWLVPGVDLCSCECVGQLPPSPHPGPPQDRHHLRPACPVRPSPRSLPLPQRLARWKLGLGLCLLGLGLCLTWPWQRSDRASGVSLGLPTVRIRRLFPNTVSSRSRSRLISGTGGGRKLICLPLFSSGLRLEELHCRS